MAKTMNGLDLEITALIINWITRKGGEQKKVIIIKPILNVVLNVN